LLPLIAEARESALEPISTLFHRLDALPEGSGNGLHGRLGGLFQGRFPLLQDFLRPGGHFGTDGGDLVGNGLFLLGTEVFKGLFMALLLLFETGFIALPDERNRLVLRFRDGSHPGLQPMEPDKEEDDYTEQQDSNPCDYG